jgi:hypothetical protein
MTPVTPVPAYTIAVVAEALRRGLPVPPDLLQAVVATVRIELTMRETRRMLGLSGRGPR